MGYVAVIDVGKTNAKLAIVDVASRQELDVSTQANAVLPGPPYPHFDIKGLWDFFVSNLTAFASRYRIDALSVTTHGASIVLLDKAGNLATPVLDYEFNGPDSTRDQYEKIKPSVDVTGSPKLPGGLNSGAQLFWLFAKFPELKESVSTILTYPQYWSYRLCGVLANEVTSLGCHTDLWLPQEKTFSTLVDDLNIKDKMANVLLPTDMLGTVLPNVAEQTGLAKTTRVYCGIHDSNASLYSHLLDRQPPFTVISTGTWVICMSMDKYTGFDEPASDVLLNVNALGNPVPSGRFMGGREYDYLCNKYNVNSESSSSLEVFDAESVRTVIDRSAIILPAVEKGSGPYPQLQYQWTVDPMMLSEMERNVAISFYLAMMTSVCLKSIRANGDLIIEGPFAANPHYCSMLCAVTANKVIGTKSGSTGTSVGAALVTIEKTPKTELSTESQYVDLATAGLMPELRAYAERWYELTQKHITVSGA